MAKFFKLGLESYTVAPPPQSTGKNKSRGQPRFKGNRDATSPQECGTQMWPMEWLDSTRPLGQ